MSRWLRIAGRPPLIAQAPTATRILALARNSRSTCTFSALQTPPSISAMSQGPQCLMSVSGERSNSAMLDELEQTLVDVEQRHVAAEAAGERSRRDPDFHRRLGWAGSFISALREFRRRRPRR